MEWALEVAGQRLAALRGPHVVVAGATARREALAERLRMAGIAAALFDGTRDDALDYARRWGYDAAVMAQGAGAAIRRDGARRAVPAGDLVAFAAWSRAHGSEDA